jgi:5,10-methylene-tetrahydrofolate dehydrogenase/methenyl tetrahydrofolate cyclohydrolase
MNLAEHVRPGGYYHRRSSRPNTVTAEMVKPGAVVIDVVVNRLTMPAKRAASGWFGDVGL